MYPTPSPFEFRAQKRTRVRPANLSELRLNISFGANRSGGG